MSEKAAIDNDFLNHLLEIKRHSDLPGLIRRFFKALDVSVFMHPLVYNREALIVPNSVRDALVDDSTISIPAISDIWENQNGGKTYYEMMVRGIYKDFTGNEYPCADFFCDWKAGKSLGEVHTVVACAFIMCDCFLSDDRGAARELQGIVLRTLNHPINIYNRENRCDILYNKAPSERQDLTTHELKLISHPVRDFDNRLF